MKKSIAIKCKSREEVLMLYPFMKNKTYFKSVFMKNKFFQSDSTIVIYLHSWVRHENEFILEDKYGWDFYDTYMSDDARFTKIRDLYTLKNADQYLRKFKILHIIK